MSKEPTGCLRISVDAARTADVDHHPRLLVLDSEIWCRFSHQSEGRSVVHCEHGIPLLIGHLEVIQGVPR